MTKQKPRSTYAVAASAVSFACLYQATQSGQHWLIITGLIFCMVAVVLFLKAFARET
jgi:hypothetical protein